LLFLVVAAASYALYLGRHVGDGLLLAFAFIPGSFIVIILHVEAERRDLEAAQRVVERAVAARLPAFRAGAAPFFLYLRPFASTGGVRVLRKVVKRKRAKSTYFGSDARYNRGPGFHYKREAFWDDLEPMLQKVLGQARAGSRPGPPWRAARCRARLDGRSRVAGPGQRPDGARPGDLPVAIAGSWHEVGARCRGPASAFAAKDCLRRAWLLLRGRLVPSRAGRPVEVDRSDPMIALFRRLGGRRHRRQDVDELDPPMP
jgi:hypothetical protein